jgi:hypothetical protein
MAQELEIYKLLVTLAATLIAVSITAYSIAISVLGSERARLQARIDDIYRRADEKFRKGEIKNLEAAEKEVASARAESKKIAAPWSRLSLVNVVLWPGLIFTLSILFAVQGIFEYPKLKIVPGEGTPYQAALTHYQTSAILLVVGALLLVVALFGIEKAAGQPRPVKVAIEPTGESGVVAYYFVDSAEKLVVDWTRKNAYWFDARIDQAAREGKIKLVAIPGKKAEAFVKDNQLTYLLRSPTPQELAL